MSSRRRFGALALTVAIILLSSCGREGPRAEMTTPTPEPSAESIETNTIRALIDAPAETPRVEFGEPVAGFADDEAIPVMYTSGGLQISGLLRVPAGDGPFPSVVAVHGGVDPSKYRSGGDLVDEQRALVESGYVVFAPDLRGYADSDQADSDGILAVDPGFGWLVTLDWGMALDVVNALRVMRDGLVDSVDPERVGLIGHSMGGLLALDAAVIAPELADVVVALSAPSSVMWDSVEHGLPPDSKYYAELVEQYGTPKDDPDYWSDISPRTFVDRMEAPLLLIHGGSDRTTLPQWSQDTAAAWRKAGKSAEAVTIDGAGHDLRPHRREAVDYTMKAIDTVLKK